ncbi:hypothetical protein L873DRAFT_1400209 [Choiromyces venosus 120613-1]|uniref:Uncharacterized protein n=1 Tax=Choiromyces venosus 120613-1 TaxID=1336337 RepID=A0A3N4JDY8_9PEZI|nr:hypothetical protein L873DRAFT_1400209 [Choiromyces venosus 120613-1]
MVEGENKMRDYKKWKLKISKMAEVLEVEEGEAMMYSMDVMLRNVLKAVGERNGKEEEKVEEKGMGEEKERKKEEKLVEKKVELEKKVTVEGGRSYKEVMVGGGLGMKSEEVERLEEKKERERTAERVACLEREKRLENMVEVVMDSQD